MRHLSFALAELTGALFKSALLTIISAIGPFVFVAVFRQHELAFGRVYLGATSALALRLFAIWLTNTPCSASEASRGNKSQKQLVRSSRRPQREYRVQAFTCAMRVYAWRRLRVCWLSLRSALAATRCLGHSVLFSFVRAAKLDNSEHSAFPALGNGDCSSGCYRHGGSANVRGIVILKW
jgi:hypothetical protein